MAGYAVGAAGGAILTTALVAVSVFVPPVTAAAGASAVATGTCAINAVRTAKQGKKPR